MPVILNGSFLRLIVFLLDSTFQGDNRPSMMVRGQIRRSSTLIDPDSLGPPPNPQDPGNRTSAFMRRSSTARPLLDSNGDRPPTIGASASTGNISQSRSVFGVDTLWDRELQKLKEIEAQERAEVEERRKHEQEDVERRQRKKRKGKSRLQETELTPPQPDARPQDVSDSRVPSEPPMLPAIQKPILRRAPLADDDMPTESESDDDDVPLGHSVGRITDKAADNWVAESSEEDEGPIRATGSGPRNVRSSVLLAAPPRNGGEDEDSEEDLPLTAAAERIVKRATQFPPPRLVDDEDEDKPLAAVLNETRISYSRSKLSLHDEDEDKPLAAVLSETRISHNQSRLSLPNFGFDNLSGEHPSTNVGDDDDDEQPLGLRASRLPAMASHASLPFTDGDGGDDDKPLALHPEQQRKTQYQMLAQLQQQQQMMVQAQMHNSFYFGSPAMMGSGFFGPPMGMAVPPLMGIPMPPSPPPVHDAAKYGRVDRWRHDVAVEGEQ